MKKFSSQQLAKCIHNTASADNSAHIPWKIANQIAEQLCLYFDEQEMWEELTPEEVMQEVEEALGGNEAYNEYLGSMGMDMVEDEDWEDYIVQFINLVNEL